VLVVFDLCGGGSVSVGFSTHWKRLSLYGRARFGSSEFCRGEKATNVQNTHAKACYADYGGSREELLP